MHKLVKLNYKFEPAKPHHERYQLAAHADLPSVDLSAMTKPILNQGQLGSCVSNAMSAALRYCLKKEGKSFNKFGEFQPSRLFCYYNGRVLMFLQDMPHATPEEIAEGVKEDTGLSLSIACEAIHKYHMCSEVNWPYDVSKFTDKPSQSAYDAAKNHAKLKYMAVNQDLATMKACLQHTGPIAIGLQVYASLMSDEVAHTGIVPMPDPENEELMGGHCMLVVGYNDAEKMFLVQNSWGDAWGMNGLCKIPYDYILNPNLGGDYWAFSFFA